MGYRSSIVCVMYGENNEADNAIVREFVRSRVDAFTSSGGREHVSKAFYYDGWGVKFECEDWKWYGDYPEIQFLEKLFEEFDEVFVGKKGYDSTYAMEYVRIGEDTADIEETFYGGHANRVYVDRSICTDGEYS